VAGLLVSVRSVAEARAAHEAGAHVIDVKDPARGPLGRADDRLAMSIRAALPTHVAVSLALGELRESEGRSPPPAGLWSGIRWRKMGFSGLATDLRWAERWWSLRALWGPGPGWVAVIYADGRAAHTPHPDAIVDVAIETRCAGLLVDTWRKGRPSPLSANAGWAERLDRARRAGLMLVVAGGLDEEAFERLAPLRPDLFAVRGSACHAGERQGEIDPRRVEALAAAAAAIAVPPVP
jgi:uncharacterized protein (UPF0264 family)